MDYQSGDSPLLSYTVYAAGFIIGAFSPEEWLILLSIAAVLLRLPVDVLKLHGAIKRILGKTPKEPPDDPA